MLLKNKKVKIVLRKEQLNANYGISYSRVKAVNRNLGLNVPVAQAFLRPDQVSEISNFVNRKYFLLNNRLKTDLLDNIKFLDQLKNNRSIRNRKGYPSRGQRTKTNGKTKKKFRT